MPCVYCKYLYSYGELVARKTALHIGCLLKCDILYRHPEAASIVTYPSIESTMRRWRKSFHPPIPDSLTAYGNILEDDQWRRMMSYNRGRIQTATVTAADNSVSVVFGNVDYINLLSDATEIFIDATFKVVPAVNGAYQLLTMMATKFDHVGLIESSISRTEYRDARNVFNLFSNISSRHYLLHGH